MASMITTTDNPFDPRTDWVSWFQWDVAQGYNTCAYLARVAYIAEEFPEEVQDLQWEQAIDEMVELHDGGLYIKLPVTEDTNTDVAA